MDHPFKPSPQLAEQLSKLLSLDESPPRWSEDDLREITLHLLNSPIRKTAPRSVRGRTLLEMLRDTHPADLVQIKDFAKAQLHHAAPLVPHEVAHLLYILSIHIAKEPISSLPAESVEQSALSIGRQHWVPDTARAMLNTSSSRANLG
jgi:hypothetical protein